MSKKYLVKIRPLEPYSMGNDQGYEYPGEDKRGKISYLAASNVIPEQTTILGMLRNVILQNNFPGYKSDFDYTFDEKKKIGQLIGRETFSFTYSQDIHSGHKADDGDGKQNFGYIESLSPVFIMSNDGDILIPNPFNNEVIRSDGRENEYNPMEIEEKDILTSFGKIKLPKEYDCKNGYGSGFFNLEKKKVVSSESIFTKHVVTGNMKSVNVPEENRKKGFFKRETFTMDNGYTFAITVILNHNAIVPQDGQIVYMGKKKSAFEISFVENTDFDFVTQVKKSLNNGPRWYYALSDLYVNREITYKNFAITEKRYTRNLKTVYLEKNGRSRGKLEKQKERTFLISRGSVFYKENPFNELDANAANIGYNCIVEIGGNN